MNKIININLGGIPFIIDEDAFEHINKYLESIRKHFSKSEGCDEILSDIEIRMAELFLEKLKSRQIISMIELGAVIDIMGKPEDFGAEPIEETKQNKSTHYSSDYKYIKTGKRLFRDEDNKIIGGVCSGLSAYLGIQDPVWIRIAFALITILGGAGILAYIVLLIVIPKAKTASDRLAMRGEPINVENIAKTIEEEIDELSQKISEFGEEFSSSKKKDKTVKGKLPQEDEYLNLHSLEDSEDELNKDFYSKRSSSSHFVSEVVDGSFRLGKWSVKGILSIIIFCIIVALVLTWSSGILGYLFAFPILRFFGAASDVVYTMSTASLALLVLLPILSLIMMFARWFVPGASKQDYKWPMAFLWIVAFALLTFSVAKTSKEYQSKYEVSNRIDIPQSESTLKLSISDMDTKLLNIDDNDFSKIHLGDNFYGNKDLLLLANVDVSVRQSGDNSFYIVEKLTARGSSPKTAKHTVENMPMMHELKGNESTIKGFSEYEKGQLYRGQHYSYDIYLPKGKSIECSYDNYNKYITDSQSVYTDIQGDKVVLRSN